MESKLAIVSSIPMYKGSPMWTNLQEKMGSETLKTSVQSLHLVWSEVVNMECFSNNEKNSLYPTLNNNSVVTPKIFQWEACKRGFSWKLFLLLCKLWKRTQFLFAFISSTYHQNWGADEYHNFWGYLKPFGSHYQAYLPHPTCYPLSYCSENKTKQRKWFKELTLSFLVLHIEESWDHREGFSFILLLLPEQST